MVFIAAEEAYADLNKLILNALLKCPKTPDVSASFFPPHNIPMVHFFMSVYFCSFQSSSKDLKLFSQFVFKLLYLPPKLELPINDVDTMKAVQIGPVPGDTEFKSPPAILGVIIRCRAMHHLKSLV